MYRYRNLFDHGPGGFETDDEVRINPFNAVESIEISLSAVPSGHDYDLYLYKSIADCENRNQLESSVEGGNEDESISWGERLNSDDSGIYVVGVKRYGSHSCVDSYRLNINGLD